MSEFGSSVQVKLKSAVFSLGDGRKSDDFSTLVTEFNIIETLDFPCMRATLAINDSIGMINLMKGNEIIELVVEDAISNRLYSYNFRIYRLGPRVRFQKNDQYVLECVSNEFMVNEISNICKSFKDKKASVIVEDLLKNTIKTRKKLFIETTKDNIKCVVPNWRPFDFINWMATKAVRSENKDQSGFIFYENIDGFHFKSFDKIIKDAKNQSKVFTYTYGEKNQNEKSKGQDIFSIQSISYPNVFDSLLGVRNGWWAGAFCGVSLDYVQNSKLSTRGKEIPYSGKTWDIVNTYDKMEHLGNTKPYLDNDPSIKALLTAKRRIRYRPNQIHLWDSKNAAKKQPTEGEYAARFEETAIYAHCRKVSFETIKLSIKVPGNLSLRCGEAVDVIIPDPLSNKDRIETDKVYSGRYVIAGVRHKYSGGAALISEIDLVKDSLGNVTPR
jgi:hypothetical protein